MFLFIFESIGTSELILVGVVALIFLGPRRMPEMAKKLGKIMADFRTTTNQFKETWEREVDFEDETKAFRMDTIEKEVGVARDQKTIEGPSVSELDPAEFEARATAEPKPDDAEPKLEPELVPATRAEYSAPTDDANDKRNWL